MKSNTLLASSLLLFSVSCNAGLFSSGPIDLVKDSVFEKLDPTVRLEKKLENLPFCKGKKQKWEVRKSEEDSDCVYFICENPTFTNNFCKAGLIGLVIRENIPNFCRNGNIIQTFWEAARDNDEKALKYFENLLGSPNCKLAGINLTKDDYYEVVEYFRKLDKAPVIEFAVGFSPSIDRKSVVPLGVFGRVTVPGLSITYPSIYSVLDNGREAQADLAHLYRADQVIFEANMWLTLGIIAHDIVKLQKQNQPKKPSQTSSRRPSTSTDPEIQYVKDLHIDGDTLENKLKSIYFCKNKKKVWSITKNNDKTVVSFTCENPTFGCPEQFQKNQNYEGICKGGIDPVVRLWEAARNDNILYLVPEKASYEMEHKGDSKGFDELVTFAKNIKTEPKNEFTLSFTLKANKEGVESIRPTYTRSIGSLKQTVLIKRIENGKKVFTTRLPEFWAKENEGKFFPDGDMSITPLVNYFANKKK